MGWGNAAAGPASSAVALAVSVLHRHASDADSALVQLQLQPDCNRHPALQAWTRLLRRASLPPQVRYCCIRGRATGGLRLLLDLATLMC